MNQKQFEAATPDERVAWVKRNHHSSPEKMQKAQARSNVPENARTSAYFRAAKDAGLEKFTSEKDHSRLTKERFLELGGAEEQWKLIVLPRAEELLKGQYSKPKVKGFFLRLFKKAKTAFTGRTGHGKGGGRSGCEKVNHPHADTQNMIQPVLVKMIESGWKQAEMEKDTLDIIARRTETSPHVVIEYKPELDPGEFYTAGGKMYFGVRAGKRSGQISVDAEAVILSADNKIEDASLLSDMDFVSVAGGHLNSMTGQISLISEPSKYPETTRFISDFNVAATISTTLNKGDNICRS